MSFINRALSIMKNHGFKKYSDSHGVKLYLKSYDEQYFMGVAISSSPTGLSLDIGLLDKPLFNKVLQIEKIEKMGIFNLTFGVSIFSSFKSDELSETEQENELRRLESRLCEFVLNFEKVLSEYKLALKSFKVPAYFANRHIREDNLIGLYLGLASLILCGDDLGEDIVEKIVSTHSNEHNRNNVVEFKIGLLKEYLSNEKRGNA